MYTLEVLEDTQFEALPFKHVKDPLTLGCADVANKKAYVRKVHWGEISPTINMLTIQHEIQELVAKTSPHEEDGIRYKKARQILAPIATVIGSIINPFLGMAIAAGTGAYEESKGEKSWGQVGLNTAMAGLGGMASSAGRGGVSAGSAWGAGAEASKAAGGGWIGQTLSGAQSALGSAPGAVTAGGGVNPTLQSVGGGTSQWVTSPGVGALGSIPGGAINVGASGFAQTAGQAIKTTGAPAGIMDMLKNPMVQLGLGSMGTAALPIASKPPELGGIISKWLTADTVTKAGEVARNIADVEYAGEFQLAKETSAFMQVMEKDIQKGYKMRRESLDKTALAANPQWKRSGERLEMLRRINEEEQREIDTMKAQWIQTAKSEHATRQYTYVMDQLKVDEATKRDLLYGELQDVIWKYNVQQEDLMNFRKIAADAGMYMVGKGMEMYG